MNTHFQKMINRMKTKQASRTKLFALSLCGVALAVLGSSQAYAVVICNPPPPISLTFPPLVFEGGADGPTIGQPITSGWGATMTSPNFLTGGADCLIATGIVLPTLQGSIVPGITYTEDGQTYPIYTTSVPSIGIIMGIKATSVANYTPVRPLPNIFFYPNPIPSQGMGIAMHAKLIVIGRLTSGVYPIATQELVNVYANGPNSETTKASVLVLNASTVTIRASTCQMSGATTQNVRLLPVSKNQFSGVGTSAGTEANFSLTTLCGSGVKLYATMSDGSDPGNTSNILKPAEGTTASGVGVQILRDGSPIFFGPDSAMSGNTNQWYIGTASSGGNELFTVPLKARYVQTETGMVAGSVKARATVTFSYQ
ncbi:Fimbrial protein [Yersinia frederiksenii]|nr:Fimbrial protein [Yersinia frederiksenii]CNL02150.1 Fimbrial protein [Yersinia frederiksenii]